MKLLDTYIFFTRNKIRKTCLQNYPSLILKLPSIQIHFTETTLGFSIITKIPFYWHFKFSKASHKHTQALHLTNTYFTLTNICLALQVYELSQPGIGSCGGGCRQ
jgi:hypothetical protein